MKDRLLDAALQAADGIVPERGGDRDELRKLGQLAALKSAFAAQGADIDATDCSELPSQWGHLRILGRLGRGGFGDVLRAYDPVLQREVALKLRRVDRAVRGSDADYIEEARRLARVRHPNVLAVYGADVADGRVGMWADLLEGQTLEQQLRTTALLPRAQVLDIASQLAAALAAIHDAGLVHGDIKADNVMREGNRVVLMDFGAGTAAGATPRFGSPLTMAPELLAGGSASERSDIYSLGALLYRAASGQFHHGDERSTPRALQRQLQPALGRPLAALVALLLSADPCRRPSSESVVEALREISLLPRRRARRIAAAAIVLALGTALVASLVGLQRVRAERDRSERIKDFVIEALQQSQPSRARGPASIIEALDFIAREADTQLAGLDDARGELLAVVGAALAALGETQRGLALLEQGVVQLRSAPRSTRRDLAHALTNLSLYRRAAGDLAGASAAAAEAQALFGDLPQTHENRLGAIRLSGMLGNLHVSAGRPLAALEVHRRTLQMRTELLGEDHPGLAVDFNNVAAAAYTAGLEQVAVQSYRQAARMLAKDGKDGSAPMSVVQLGLARALHEAGQADAAAQHLQRALELARANFPPGHSKIWQIRERGVRFMAERGEHAAAVREYQQLFADAPQDADLLRGAQIYYAAALLEMDRPAEAIELFQAALRPGTAALVDVAQRQAASAGLLLAEAMQSGARADTAALQQALVALDRSQFAGRPERGLLERWITRAQAQR